MQYLFHLGCSVGQWVCHLLGNYVRQCVFSFFCGSYVGHRVCLFACWGNYVKQCVCVFVSLVTSVGHCVCLFVSLVTSVGR